MSFLEQDCPRRPEDDLFDIGKPSALFFLWEEMLMYIIV